MAIGFENPNPCQKERRVRVHVIFQYEVWRSWVICLTVAINAGIALKILGTFRTNTPVVFTKGYTNSDRFDHQLALVLRNNLLLPCRPQEIC